MTCSFPFHDVDPREERRERGAELVRQHGEEFVLGRHLALEARSGFLELPRPEVFLEDRVAEHLQQFTMHDELGLGHGLLLQRHRPEPLERHVVGSRESLDG